MRRICLPASGRLGCSHFRADEGRKEDRTDRDRKCLEHDCYAPVLDAPVRDRKSIRNDKGRITPG